MSETAKSEHMRAGRGAAKAGRAIFIGFAFVVIPLCYCPAFIDPVLSLRFTLLAILVSLLCLARLPQHSPEDGRRISVPMTVFGALLFGYCALSIASVFWAFNKAEAIFDAARIFLFCSFTWLVCLLLRESYGGMRAVARVITIVSAVIALLGILEYWEVARLIYVRYAPGVTMINRNLLSSYLFCCLGFTCLGAVSDRGPWRIAGFASSALIFYLITAVQTRAVWVAIVASAVCAILLAFMIGTRRAWGFIRGKRLSVPALVLLLVISAAAGGSIRNSHRKQPSLLKRATSISDASFNANRERLLLWQKTMTMIREHPLLGVGAGNWKIQAPRYGVGDLILQDTHTIEVRPHNDFLWVWSETGSIGILSYLGLFIFCGIMGVRTVLSTRDPEVRLFSGMSVATLAGIAVISFFDFPKERIEHLVMIGTCMASCVAGWEGGEKAKTILLPARWRRGAGVVIMALCVACLWVGMKRLKGDMHATSLRDAWEIRKLHEVIEESDKAFSACCYSLDPSSMPLHWYRGTAAFLLGDTARAFKDFTTAMRYNPNNNHLLNDLGTCWSLRGDQVRAHAHFSAALAISPGFEPALINRAALYYNAGRYADAYATILKCKPPHSDPRYERFFRELSAKMKCGGGR